MGLFSFLNGKKNKPAEGKQEFKNSENNLPGADQADKTTSPPPENGIQFLYYFLEQNFESKGYDDALMNSDNTNLVQNVDAIKNDLSRNIRKVKTYYEDLIRKTDFHIASRSRSGMVDTVEELEVEKEMAKSHIEQIVEIERDAARNEGVGQGVVLSYTRGFKNGLAAISHHTIIKKNF